MSEIKQKPQNILATEKISHLIKKFAIPCVISLLIASLYNIVDQIYIGWSPAGAAGNAATNVVYPFTVIALGLALLIGDGAATLFNLSLGAKDFEKANKSIGNGVSLLVILSILITALGLIFEKEILSIFGANPAEKELYSYAHDYFRIICIGFPFYIIGQGLNNSIRSDGSPKFAMMATIVGAVTNIILDPVFIFALKMEVKGAAIATVIGQVLTFAMSVVYLTRAKQYKISKKSLKLDWKISKTLMMLGITSLVTQLSIVVVIATSNNMIARFGYETIAASGEAYGVITPLAVIGISMKVFGIVISFVIGTSIGGMPIIGFNMGAGNIARIKETVRQILFVNGIIGFIAFLLYELFPDFIINIFGGSNSSDYFDYARHCFRIMQGGIILTCLIKSISIILQSMGSAWKSTLVSLSRDIILNVPLTIFVTTWSKNVVTMMWAPLISDVIGIFVALILLVTEMKKIGKIGDNAKSPEEKDPSPAALPQNDRVTHNGDVIVSDAKHLADKKFVVTVSREYASGGSEVAEILAKKLGVKCYDKEIIELAAKKQGYTEEYVRSKEEQSKTASSYDDKLFEVQSHIIDVVSKNESCVVVGRCADYVLRDHKDVIKVFLYAPKEKKIERAVKLLGLDEKSAEKEISRMNAQRAKHYEHFTGGTWSSYENYDYVLNVASLGVEGTAGLLKDIVEKKLG
ncbi:MAG: MATE family efflux transporter [Treponema sp.]|nr:MATE family efflux transporter [Treponema sp.]